MGRWWDRHGQLVSQEGGAVVGAGALAPAAGQVGTGTLALMASGSTAIALAATTSGSTAYFEGRGAPRGGS